MENPNIIENPVAGLISTVVCFVHLIFALALNNIEFILRIGASGVAIIAGIMAIRYHNLAYIEKKEIIKKLKSNP